MEDTESYYFLFRYAERRLPFAYKQSKAGGSVTSITLCELCGYIRC